MDEIMKSSPECNASIVKSWLFHLLSELEINKVLEASKTQNGDTLTITIKFKHS